VRLNQYGTFPDFSPDGRWVAYSSNDGIQVSPVPGTGAVQTVAPASGDEPVWSPRGDELYYREGKRWMSVPVSTREGLVAGKPRLLFERGFANVDWKSYDVAPDGRFLLLLGPSEQTIGHLNVVTNFFAELEKK
jgi:Tol biopolymer transport system component